MAKSILLLGADGQVGWELRRTLAPLGPVTACTRAEADLADLDHLRAVAAAAELIVNAAAYTAVDKAESEPELADLVNHRAVAVLAETARARGARLVHYSTDYVFDGAKPAPYIETDAVNPLSVYGATKLAGERAIAASGCRHLVFRTSWVYAARGRNFVRTMLRLAQERDELAVVADQLGAPTSARLIAELTARALAKPIPDGLYHLAAAGETSWHGFAVFVLTEARRLGWPMTADPGRVRPIPTSGYPTPARRPANSRLATDRLRTALGVVLPPWQDDARAVVAALINADRSQADRKA